MLDLFTTEVESSFVDEGVVGLKQEVVESDEATDRAMSLVCYQASFAMGW